LAALEKILSFYHGQWYELGVSQTNKLDWDLNLEDIGLKFNHL